MPIGFASPRERIAVSTLTDIQVAMRDALVDGHSAAVVPVLIGGTRPEHRLAIHQRHYVASLTRALVERFQGIVFGLSVRLLTHRHDAEDVTQEVFIRVFRSLRRWDRTRPLQPWILGIAVNRCRTWMARRARRPEPSPTSSN